MPSPRLVANTYDFLWGFELTTQQGGYKHSECSKKVFVTWNRENNRCEFQQTLLRIDMLSAYVWHYPKNQLSLESEERSPHFRSSLPLLAAMAVSSGPAG